MSQKRLTLHTVSYCIESSESQSVNYDQLLDEPGKVSLIFIAESSQNFVRDAFKPKVMTHDMFMAV